MTDQLTADESATLMAAMLDLVEQGDHDGAQHLAELAQDPEKFREVLRSKPKQ